MPKLALGAEWQDFAPFSAPFSDKDLAFKEVVLEVADRYDALARPITAARFGPHKITVQSKLDSLNQNCRHSGTPRSPAMVAAGGAHRMQFSRRINAVENVSRQIVATLFCGAAA